MQHKGLWLMIGASLLSWDRSLQELAPMSYSFIGGYLMNPYISQFEEAINRAATQFEETQQQDEVLVTPSVDQPKKPYTLVSAKHVGYTGIIMFVREKSRVLRLEDAEVGFGAAEMGNKGAVGLRVLYSKDNNGEMELTFVATHLAAMEWNLPTRNANWGAIMRGLTFENPKDVIERHKTGGASPINAVPSSDAATDDETAGLLYDGHHEQHISLQQSLHEISVFKPSSHLFVAGDLNYRISTTSPPPSAKLPSLDPKSENYYPKFLPLDQLTRERHAGRTMHGLSEAEVKFPPTYKYVHEPSTNRTDDSGFESKFATHRYPSWTDRILYLDTPSWVKGQPPLKVHSYDAMPILESSDHRPVYLRIGVPLISPEHLRPPPELVEQQSSGSASGSGVSPAALGDPRLRLPVEIDPEAWERRAAARRKEVMAGWSMFLWSTKQGAWILGMIAATGFAAYWVYYTTVAG